MVVVELCVRAKNAASMVHVFVLRAPSIAKVDVSMSKRIKKTVGVVDASVLKESSALLEAVSPIVLHKHQNSVMAVVMIFKRAINTAESAEILARVDKSAKVECVCVQRDKSCVWVSVFTSKTTV